MLNLLVIRATDINQAKCFYEQIGLSFESHQHGNGLPHLTAEKEGLVFEIYPANGKDTSDTRLGFSVTAPLEQTITAMLSTGGKLLSAPKPSPWGRRAVVCDPDGHKVELIQTD